MYKEAVLTFEKVKEFMPVIKDAIMFNEPREKTAAQLGVSKSSTDTLKAAYRFILKGEWEQLLKNRNISYSVVRGVAEYAGAEIPEQVTQEYEKRIELAKIARFENGKRSGEIQRKKAEKMAHLKAELATLKAEAGKETADYANDTVLVPSQQACPIWEQQNLLNQAKLIELMESLCDAVIPKHTKDLEEKLNRIETQLVRITYLWQ